MQYQQMSKAIAEHRYGKREKKEGYGLYYNHTLIFGRVEHYAMCVAEQKRLLQYTNQFRKENFKIK